MAAPFALPDGNSIVNRIPSDEVRGVSPRGPVTPLAQYHADHVMAEDITLTVLQSAGEEHDYDYLLLINMGRPEEANLMNPELIDGAYARSSLLDAIHAFLETTTDGPRAATQAVRNKLHEPYDSKEEYLEATDKREQAEWERERRAIHEEARKEWRDEKRSREVIEELERTKHELSIPTLPDVTEEVERICERYVQGEITFYELEQQLDAVLSEQQADDE